MGPVEKELRSWCKRHERTGTPNPGLSRLATVVYLGAATQLAVTSGDYPDTWEEAMSEAIEAAEALGL